MTINEAITKCNYICPNAIESSYKIDLLSQLDGRVQAEIYDKYENSTESEFSGYTVSTPNTTDLLIPFPYDNIYVHWLVANIYLYLNEISQYNNWIEIFNSDMDSFERYYAQSHHAKGASRFTYF